MLSAKDGKVSTIEKIENGIIKTDKLELWQEISHNSISKF